MAKAQGQEVLNENTAEVAERVQVGGGEAVSFDELDSLMSTKRSDVASKHTDEEPAPAETVAETEEKPAKAAKQTQVDKDLEVNGKTHSKKEGKDGKEATEKENVDAASGKVKLYTVKNGDKDVELRADTKLTATVGGKAEDVTVQELLNQYSGKVAYDRKFKELDTASKKFEAQRKPVQAMLDEIYKRAITQKDRIGSVNYMCEVLGIDAGEFWADTTKDLEAKMEERAKLSPEERRQKDLEEENTRLKEKESARRKTEAEKQAYSELDGYVTKRQEALGIDNKQFVELYDELTRSGQVSLDKLTDREAADLVFDFHVELKAREDLSTLLAEVNPEFEEQALDSAIDQMRDVMSKHPELTMDDLRNIAVEAFGNKAAKNLSKKLQKSKPSDTARPAKERREDPVSFDDLN